MGLLFNRGGGIDFRRIVKKTASEYEFVKKVDFKEDNSVILHLEMHILVGIRYVPKNPEHEDEFLYYYVAYGSLDDIAEAAGMTPEQTYLHLTRNIPYGAPYIATDSDNEVMTDVFIRCSGEKEMKRYIRNALEEANDGGAAMVALIEGE